LENQNGRMYFRSDPVKYCHHPTREEKSSASEHCQHDQPQPQRASSKAKRRHAAAARASGVRGCVARWGNARQRGAAEARDGAKGMGRVAVAHQSLKNVRSKDPPLYSSSSCKKSHVREISRFSSNWSKPMRPFWSNHEKGNKIVVILMGENRKNQTSCSRLQFD